MPGASIWQWKPCEFVNAPHVSKALQCIIQTLTFVLLLRAGELNDREVPVVMEPVLVTESEGLADREAKSGQLREKNK